MAKILGLDLGTNSIGWAVVDETDENPILNKGVRIFSEGVKIEKGVESSKASERTEYRSARRLKFRRKLRKYQTLKVLIENKMCPLSFEELENWKQNKVYPKNEDFINWLRIHEDKNPYFFRNLVSKEKLDLENESERFMLGRAFYHLAQRRGFKSNRLDQSEDNEQEFENFKIEIERIIKESETITNFIIETEHFFEEEFDNTKVKRQINSIKRIIKYWKTTQRNNETLNIEEEKQKISNIINKKENLGDVKKNIIKLSEKMQENNCDTLGQYFYKLYTNDRHKAENKIRNNYTSREKHYESEFYEICKIQNLPSELCNKLHNAIFYQRPLKSQKGLVGKCTFEPSKPRCPLSHPLFEIYRMLTFINNIKYKVRKTEKDICKGKDCKNLSKEQKKIIIDLFFRKKAQFDFSDIIKKLDKKNEYVFNFKPYASVSACPVNAHFKAIFVNSEDWKNYDFNQKIHYYKNIKFEYTREKDGKISEIDLFDIWHVVFSFDKNEKIIEFAKKRLNASEKQANALLRVPIKQGYAALSLKAVKNIIPYLEEGLIYSKAVFLANINKVVGKEIWENQENQEIIKSEIINLIDDYTFYSISADIINDLIGWHKKEYNNANSDYELDETDLNKIEEKFNSFYSDEILNKYSEEQIKATKEFIKTEFLKALRKSYPNSYRFYKKLRLDEKINSFLKDNFDVSEKALKKMYHPSDIDIYPESKDGFLHSPRTESVKNPVVMKTLHQLRRLINSLLKNEIIGKDVKVHVELAREMNDANMRKAIEIWQDKLKNENEQYEKVLIELFKEYNKKELPKPDDIEKMRIWADQLENVTKKEEILKIKKTDIEKYKLWKEQKGICIYTGKQISISELFNGIAFDVEHTIPLSLSYDNSLRNKTIADSRFNRHEKIGKTPFQLKNHADILSRIEHWKEKYEKLNKEIESIKKQIKVTQDKDKKDKLIQKRHVLRFEHDYWKDKYKRFTLEEVKRSFKKSQLNDTRTISKLTRAYMKTVFPKVHTVNGGITAYMRKKWGLEEKSRGNHIHHAVDAVVVACMTKKRTADLEKYFKQAENEKVEPRIPKPWNSFKTDVENIKNDTLIYHFTDDNVLKQTKKKLRKRGKIVPKIIYKKDKSGNYIFDNKGNKIIESYVFEEKDGKKIPIFGKELSENDIISKKEGIDYIKFENNKGEVKYYEFARNKKGEIIYKKQAIYLQGNTFRNAIHQDTLYGSIKQAEKDKKTGNILHENGKIITKTDKKGNPIISYVVRRKIADLKDSEINKIVDDRIREIVAEGKKTEAKLLKEIDKLKKQKTKTDGKEEEQLEKQIEALQYKIENEIYVIPPNVAKGKTQYMPIKKVRIIAKPKDPLIIKKQRDKSKENHEHKENIYAVTEGNYCIALYQKTENDKTSREVLPVNYQNIANEIRNYYNEKKKGNKLNKIINLPDEIAGKPFYTLLKKGLLVLFYEQHPDEINWNDKQDLQKRLYKITELSSDGRIKLKFHQNAMNNDKLKDFFIKKLGEEELNKNKTLVTGMSKYVYGKNYPKLHISKGNFNFLIQGKDFIFSNMGEIVEL